MFWHQNRSVLPLFHVPDRVRCRRTRAAGQPDPASLQQLLLNFLLQECDSRILQHQEQAAAAKLDKAKNNTCCEQQCPWTQFLCTLSKIGTRLLAPLGSKGENRNSLACLRNTGSYHDFKFAESYCTSNTTAPPLASYVPKPLP